MQMYTLQNQTVCWYTNSTDCPCSWPVVSTKSWVQSFFCDITKYFETSGLFVFLAGYCFREYWMPVYSDLVVFIIYLNSNGWYGSNLSSYIYLVNLLSRRFGKEVWINSWAVWWELAGQLSASWGWAGAYRTNGSSEGVYQQVCYI